VWFKDLERAYANFFARRADFPRFKKKRRHESFRYPDPKQIKLDQGTSRTCPGCGHVSADNRKTQARFACVVACGLEENADVVGAINILRTGHVDLSSSSL